MAADYHRENQQRAAQSLVTGPQLPNSIIFRPGAGETPRENNLPYEMSLIEHGELQRAFNGGVAWNTDIHTPPRWFDGKNQQVTSFTTGRPIIWLSDLPFSISQDVPAWQLTLWYRSAASQGWKLTQQDIFDRLANPLSRNTLSKRTRTWQHEIGLLPHACLTLHNWPSRQNMEVVSHLSYAQLKFNTWWDVRAVQNPADPSKQICIAIQSEHHEGYSDSSRPLPLGTTYTAPYYIIENPQHRQMSEQVKLMDDAMLFLTIKADECGIAHGFSGVMSWIAKPAGDKWTENLDSDLVCEFERWREGCSDSPSVDALRSALEQAGSEAEREAIKSADYNLTPSLQGVVDGLAAAREKRRLRDEETKGRIEKGGRGTKRKA